MVLAALPGSRLTLVLSLIASLPTVVVSQFGTIKIDWKQGNGFAMPVVDLKPHLADDPEDLTAELSDAAEPLEEHLPAAVAVDSLGRTSSAPASAASAAR